MPDQSEISESSLLKFNFVLKSPLECAPRGAFKSGGSFHVHPMAGLLTATTPAPIEDDPFDWGAASIESIEPKVHTTYNRRHMTFQDLSLKARRTQTGESHHEFANYMEREVNPRVVDLQLGGLRLTWQSQAGERRYTPDCVAVTEEGTIVVDEVKAHASYFQHDANYARLMERVGHDLSSRGIEFRKVDSSDRPELRQMRLNVRRAFQHRHTCFTAANVAAVRNLAERTSNQAPLGEVEQVIDVHHSVNRQIVNAMMCARVIAYDLNEQLTPDTIVSVVAPLSRPALDIRSIAIAG